MLLQKLREYSERLVLPPTLYSELAVRYIIDLDAQGRCLGIIDTSDPSTPRTRRGQLRFVPEVLRTSNPFAFLLCDVAGYALGIPGEKDKPERIAGNHQLFVDLTRDCAEKTGEPSVQAVLRFLEGDRANLVLPADFDTSGRIIFRVEGEVPTDLPVVQRYWEAVNDLTSSYVTKCVICSDEKDIPRKLPSILKGVPGGQPGGTYLLFVNDGAFDSYGLNSAIAAPVCLDCSERFTKAANALLGNRESRTILAGSVFTYWTREDIGFNLLSYFDEPAPEAVGTLLESVRIGGPRPEIDETRLYATVLSGNSVRAVVRDWIDTTVGEVKSDLARWFRRQSIVDAYGEPPRPLGLTALAGGTVRRLSDIPSPTIRSLMRGALTSSPLSMSLLSQALRRNRAEQTVTRPRAALIKLVLSSQPGGEWMEETMVELDPQNDNAAYRCGRLLAVLERAQQVAIPGVNATLVDRYFGTASSAPESVFPRLIRGAQPHLAKIERDNRGAARALQRRIEEILAGLPVRKEGALHRGFPATLSLSDQGLFSLGYYHERAFNRAQAAARRAGQAAGPGTSGIDPNDDNDLDA